MSACRQHSSVYSRFQGLRRFPKHTVFGGSIQTLFGALEKTKPQSQVRDVFLARASTHAES
jgi:hypothetical protein